MYSTDEPCVLEENHDHKWNMTVMNMQYNSKCICEECSHRNSWLMSRKTRTFNRVFFNSNCKLRAAAVRVKTI